jgi:hypothetical protein
MDQILSGIRPSEFLLLCSRSPGNRNAMKLDRVPPVSAEMDGPDHFCDIGDVLSANPRATLLIVNSH